jgi:hypothetical protein
VAVTLAAFNTIALTANAAVQLVSGAGGHHQYYIINLGTGNLYIKQSAAPTGVSDAAAMKIPAANTSIIPIFISGGLTGIWVMADATGSISIMDAGIR